MWKKTKEKLIKSWFYWQISIEDGDNMTHLEELFNKYCSKYGLCDDCKYYKDKRVLEGKSCNEAYEEDYYKRYGKDKTK